MANVVEAEPRDSQEWFGSYLDEDGIVADIVKRVTCDEIGLKRWLDPVSWQFDLPAPGRPLKDIPPHAGCLVWAGMSIRNFYGMWHADNPHTVFSVIDDVKIEDGIITDPRHPDNWSDRIIERVKAELRKLSPEPLAA